MLIQHILTEQIFRDIFPASEFHRANHLARALTELEGAFLQGETRQNLLIRLEPYYIAIRRAAAGAIFAPEKQEFLKAVYEDFYTAYNPKDADRLGVVYTPGEVVRFIVAGCDWLAQQHFSKPLADPDLDILDPCTGTGTFVVELLDWLRSDRAALTRKYTGEIHANEVAILPYYIACLNIEQTYAEITGTWREFPGACFVDTLDNWGFELTHRGAQSDLFGALTEENRRRIQNQNARRIPVILGNPPYNANQKNENENNKNQLSPIADARIKETYLAESRARKTKLYDPFIRFFRWASDRIGDEGIVAFITNRSFIDKYTFDGFRKAIAREFQEVWLVDLKGDSRTSGGEAETQGGNIFNIRVGVAIAFLVRNSQREGCEIRYLTLDHIATGLEKRRWLATHPFRQLARDGDFTRIRPNEYGDWINRPTLDWSAFLPTAHETVKAWQTDQAIFRLFSLGISTNRDAWLYDFNPREVSRKVRYLIKNYRERLKNSEADDGGIKWSRNLKRRLAQGKTESYSKKQIRPAFYRPFVSCYLYDSPLFVDERGSASEIFPSDQENSVIVLTGANSQKPFMVQITSKPCDLHYVGAASATICLPLWIYAADGSRQDNITDWTLTQFRTHYGDPSIEKSAIFEYVYAVLHDPNYRQTYALNLKVEFPRIPFYMNFPQWVAWGKTLITLHTGFKTVEPWPLQRVEVANDVRPIPRLKADKAAGIIVIDSVTRLEDIPPEAWDYRLGHRSALEWILDQYQEKPPRDPTIREQFNTYRFANYKETVIDLLRRVTRVSVETRRILAAMAAQGPQTSTAPPINPPPGQQQSAARQPGIGLGQGQHPAKNTGGGDDGAP
jgi:predicted helicase